MNGERLKNRASEVDLDTKVAFLKQSESYPERPLRIDAVETHMSWIFLTGRHAYKLKKPVHYEFLDFSTLDARRRNCAEEVRLNRRLARDVYLGALPLIVDSGGSLRIGGDGETVDWLVHMRRLPADRMLDYLIRHRALETEDLRRVARTLTLFYQSNPPVRLSGREYYGRLERNVCANLQELVKPEFELPADLVQRVRESQLGLLQREPALVEARADRGRIVEGHGDLRPEHVCLEPRPVIFDCLEFNRAFRIIDPVDELGFLAMECDRLGAPTVGDELFAIYTPMLNDKPPQSLINFYKANRACLRAKLSIWHTRDLEEAQWPKWRARAIEYLKLAQKYCSDSCE